MIRCHGVAQFEQYASILNVIDRVDASSHPLEEGWILNVG